MKKTLLISSLLCSFSAYAEDILQVTPFSTIPGITYNWEDEEYPNFKIQMNNDTKSVAAIAMKITLPNGIDLDTSADEGDDCYAIMLSDEDNTSGRYKYKKGAKYTSTGHSVKYNLLTTDEDGNKTYKILVSGSDVPIQKTSGDILEVIFTTSNSIAVGVYPIYITEIELTNVAAETNYEIPSTTSYVVVGTPSNATLALEGAIPSFVNSALATETAISILDLTNVTASNGTFTYVDGRTVVAPSATVNSTVAYNHAAAAENSYYSFRLPFTANVDCYTLGQIDGGTARFSPVSTLSANTSAIAHEAINIEEADVDLKGVAPTEAMTGFYYLGSENNQSVLRKYTSTATSTPAFRGYWQGGQASNLRITFEDETTGISALETEKAENTFDLQGRRVANASNGVFIVNGKKIIK